MILYAKNIATPLQKNKLPLLLILLFIATPAFAAESGSEVLGLLSTGFKGWIPTIKQACMYIFFSLVIIDLTWTFGLKALSGFEIGEFMVTIVKKIMIIGIFIFLFNADYWLQILFNSFIQLASNVGSISITPDNAIEKALDIVTIIIGIDTWNPLKAFFAVVCGVIILIAFVLMAIDLLIAYVKFLLLNVVVYFALALGGLEHFKQIGLKPILTAIKVGVEVFMLQAIMALCITELDSAITALEKEMTLKLSLQILIMSIIFAMITKIVPSVIEACFVGGLGEGAAGAAGFRAVAATTGGAIVGGAVMAAGIKFS